MFALGDVTDDLRESCDLPVFAAESRQHHIGPVFGAILAHQYNFGFEAALFVRNNEATFGNPGLSVRGGKDVGEMSSNDLVGAIALDRLRGGVPGEHASLRV